MVGDAEAKVESEIELLNKRMESIKNSTRASLVKFFIGCFGIFAGGFLSVILLTTNTFIDTKITRKGFKIGVWIIYSWKQSSVKPPEESI